MAPGSRARRKAQRSSAQPGSRARRKAPPSSAQPGSVGHNERKEPARYVEAPTPRDADAVAPVSAPASTSGILKYTEEDFQRITKLYINSFVQAQAQVNRSDQAPRERLVEAQFPDLYFGKSHLEYYHFCHQCEDHFNTAGVTGFNRTPFAASFLRGTISLRWHQHKRRSLVDRPLPWIKFKAFLREYLGDSRAFVDSIWSRIKRDSQYQQEEVLDWAYHLEHLQAILKEFDAAGAPEESDLIRLFREGLKPSVKAQMEQLGRGLDSWDELVEQAIDAEAKASLHLQEIDDPCPRGNRPVHTTVAKTKASLIRDPREEPSKKVQDKPTHSLRSEEAETLDKKSWEKKEQYSQEQERDQNPGISATRVHTTRTSVARTSGKVPKDLSQLSCYNCCKKGHYARNCPEPRGASDRLGHIHVNCFGTRSFLGREVNAMHPASLCQKDERRSPED